jgi:hypothetical protein
MGPTKPVAGRVNVGDAGAVSQGCPTPARRPTKGTPSKKIGTRKIVSAVAPLAA